MPISSPISDEIIRIEAPPATSLLISAKTSAFAPTSMPRVGSSKMMMRAPLDIQRARMTFCWLPPLKNRTSRVSDAGLILSSST